MASAEGRHSRNLYVFGATSFLNDTASEMAYWILPAFLSSLGAGPAALGLSEGIAESSASFTKLLSGYLADRLPRRKPIVVGGYAVANLVKPLLAVATSWWQVLLIRLADRTAKGMRGAPRDVMLAESVPAERVGAAFGLMQAMDTAGHRRAAPGAGHPAILQLPRGLLGGGGSGTGERRGHGNAGARDSRGGAPQRSGGKRCAGFPAPAAFRQLLLGDERGGAVLARQLQ